MTGQPNLTSHDFDWINATTVRSTAVTAGHFSVVAKRWTSNYVMESKWRYNKYRDKGLSDNKYIVCIAILWQAIATTPTSLNFYDYKGLHSKSHPSCVMERVQFLFLHFHQGPANSLDAAGDDNANLELNEVTEYSNWVATW